MKSVLRQCAFVLTLLLGLPLLAFSQNQVRGKVTGDSNEPLIGATIQVKGSTEGATTDNEGMFSISAERNATLIVSYVGFETQEVNIGNQTSLNIQLATNAEGLNEVVVIGYGQRKVKDITGSVASVSSKELAKTVTMNPELAMQGRLAGVYVSTPGSAPTARPQVRIRGVSTFGNAEPLYVVDGVPLYEQYNGTDGIGGSAAADLRGTVNILSLLNPNDIESISVLKDASAAAIYGVRAANGVILITTKKGKIGKPRVEVSASSGVQSIVNRFEVLGTQEYVNFYKEAFAANPDAANTDPAKFLPTIPTGNFYDWQEFGLNNNAAVRDFSTRISGANESTNYYISAGYGFQDAPFKGNNLGRYSFATNINTRISKFVSAGLTYRYTYATANDAAFSTGQPYNLERLATTSPFQPILDQNNPFGYAPVANVTFKANANFDPDKLSSGPPQEIDKATLLWGPNTRSNLFAMQDLNQVTYDLYRNLGTAYLQISPFAGFAVRGTLSADMTYNWRRTFSNVGTYVFNQTPGNPFAIGDGTSKAQAGERHLRNVNLVKEFSVTYTKQFGKHNIDLLANRMDQTLQYLSLGAGNDQINLTGEQFQTLQGSPNRFNNVGGGRDEQTLVGYLGRVSYNYDGKYYLDATVRRDGSSRFAPENRWGVFPSMAAAWRISSESFMKNLSFINDLKIRSGYGQLGNQETRAFAFLSSVSNASSYSFGSGAGNAVGNANFGAVLPDFPNRDLSWEKATTFNLGFDGSFLNNKLTATIEYYDRLTDGILQFAALPANVGNLNQPVFNIASVRNKGMEFQLGWNQKVGQDLQIGISANLTTVNNKVEKLFRDEPFGGEGGRIEVGMPLGYLWGYKVGGVFQNQAQIDEWKKANADKTVNYASKPGDMWFQDVNRAPAKAGDLPSAGKDSLINQFDRTFIGNTIPGHFYGFNFNLNWKGFDAGVFFQGVGDVQQINGSKIALEGMSYSNLPNQSVNVKNRWTEQNPSTTMPRAVINDPNGNNRFSDRWVENAGFLRLRNLTLGYTLDRENIGKIGGFAENIRLYVMGSNLMTLTQWTGVDPEQANRDGQVVPPARAWTFGANVTF
jgi:TonB-dependent starch-binding outer membrane protein SusC